MTQNLHRSCLRIGLSPYWYTHLERVMHRDISSSNILLDENWAANISNFGLSRTGPAGQEYTDVTTKPIKGTFGYMVYFITHRFTRKKDVYSFGVVLLEVLSERPAVDRIILDEDRWGLAGWEQCYIYEEFPHHLIGPNLKWELSQTSLVEFVQIVGQCLNSCPKKRPRMSEVVAKLELALALQLHSDVPLDDDLFESLWPFGSQSTDSSSKQLETMVVLERSDAKPSNNNNRGLNSKLPEKLEMLLNMRL